MILRFTIAASAAALFAAALPCTAMADTAVRAVLRPAATVTGADYALRDIADLEGGDAATRARLAALIVGTAPRRGYTDAVGRMQLAAHVRQLSGIMDIVWDGADQIRIRSIGQRIATEMLADAAVKALHAAYAGQYTTIALRPVAVSEGVNAPAGHVQLEARVPPQQLAKRMSALVDVRVDGKFYTTVPVWFAVDAMRPALVAKATLSPGTPLTAGDFETKAVAVTAPGASPALAAGTPVDALRLRHALPAGTKLAAANVETRPAVARAETVAVRVVAGAVTIEPTGVALADARLGETINVQNTNSSEVYAARVTGPGTVQVLR
jgi:flagella basal body P-ring formation protein FlgA